MIDAYLLRRGQQVDEKSIESLRKKVPQKAILLWTVGCKTVAVRVRAEIRRLRIVGARRSRSCCSFIIADLSHVWGSFGSVKDVSNEKQRMIYRLAVVTRQRLLRERKLRQSPVTSVGVLEKKFTFSKRRWRWSITARVALGSRKASLAL